MKNIFFWILTLVIIFSISLEAKSFGFSNYLPIVQKGEKNITIKISTLSRGDDFYIYYKTKGLNHYQVRKMKINSEGEIYYRLPVENLYGNKLEYFIYEKNRREENPISPVFTIINFTKSESPEIYFVDAVDSGSTVVKKKNPFIKISPSYSSSIRIYDNSQYPGEAFSNNGSIKLYRNIYDNEYQFDFESTFSYLDQIGPDESHINLSSMIVRFKKGSHKFEAGDVSINHTDFTTSYLNRRGLNYEMDGKNIYLNLFSINSQQKTGFEGFGIPIPDANLFGAATGYKAGQMFSVKAMFITGKDRVDSKTIYSNDDPYREGSLISVWSELKLLKNSLTIKGEFAQSNFGKGKDSGSLSKEEDNAWKTSLNYYKGIFSANASYKKIGMNYHSIANLMMLNDREGLNAGVGLNLTKLTWNVSYIDQKNYLNSTLYNMERTKELKTDVSWTLGNHFSLGGEFGINNLDYDESTGLSNYGSAMITKTYGASLRYYSGNNSITLGVGKTESENFSSKINASLSISLMSGRFLSFMPSVSYVETENFKDNSTSKMINATLSSELKFIPDFFSVKIFSSYYSSESVNSETESFSADVGLNFYMAKLFKDKITPNISFKGMYKREQNGGISTDSISVYLKADISF